MKELTDRQKRFCDEYLIDLNATQAAIRAGYSEKTANEQGSRLLANVSVQKYIQQRKKDRVERTEITQDFVLRELMAIASANATDFARVVEREGKDSNGDPFFYQTIELALTEDLTEDQKKALAVIKRGSNGIEVKSHDKVRALELLGKHLGMWTEKLEVKEKKTDPFDELTVEELRQLIADD